MPIQLFYYPGSCALAPHILLEETGLEFDPIMIDLGQKKHQSPEYLHINPKGTVPALIHDDFLITENLAILRYIAQLVPEKNLWPNNPHTEARCIEWISWLSSTLHPSYRHVIRPDRYATGEAAMANVVALGKVTTRKYWESIEQKLKETPWLLGDDYSVADAYLLVYWMWGRGKALAYEMAKDFPKWTSHAKRMGTRPAVKRALMRENINLP